MNPFQWTEAPSEPLSSDTETVTTAEEHFRLEAENLTDSGENRRKA